MSRRGKFLGAGAALLAGGVLVVALVLRYAAPCAQPPPETGDVELAVAVTLRCYGPPEVLSLDRLPVPIPDEEEILVRVHAAAINPLEWHYMQGKPYIMRLSSGIGRPSDSRLGVDFAGTVVAVGDNVQRFRPGDEVFGGRNGALGEYLVVRENGIVEPKPGNVTFEEAAGVPVAATTALQALRDRGALKPGQRVLVNGASGGVGTFAVQIAKAFGAHVTGVSSTRNLELVRSLGADHVIDYTRENFTEGDQRWDLIIDNVGNHPFRAYRRVMEPDGILVMVGGPKENRWFGPVLWVARGAVYSRFVSQTFAPFLSEFTPEDLAFLRERMEAGELRTVIDQSFTLSELPAAMKYLELGRTRGKNVIVIGADP